MLKVEWTKEEGLRAWWNGELVPGVLSVLFEQRGPSLIVDGTDAQTVEESGWREVLTRLTDAMLRADVPVNEQFEGEDAKFVLSVDCDNGMYSKLEPAEGVSEAEPAAPLPDDTKALRQVRLSHWIDFDVFRNSYSGNDVIGRTCRKPTQ